MAIKSIWEPLLKELHVQLNAAGPDTKLFITGHSKGGGMASILAMLLNNESGIPTPEVYTYASPKPGDVDFAKGYNAIIKQESYENYLDLVPLLPPSDSIIKLFSKIPLLGDLFKKAQGWNYTSVGKRYYIKQDGLIVPNTSFLEDIRIGEIIYNLIKKDSKVIVDAHCHLCKASDCAGGYMKAACKQEICNQLE